MKHQIIIMICSLASVICRVWSRWTSTVWLTRTSNCTCCPEPVRWETVHNHRGLVWQSGTLGLGRMEADCVDLKSSSWKKKKVPLSVQVFLTCRLCLMFPAWAWWGALQHFSGRERKRGNTQLTSHHSTVGDGKNDWWLISGSNWRMLVRMLQSILRWRRSS